MYNEYIKGMPILCDHMGWNSQRAICQWSVLI